MFEATFAARWGVLVQPMIFQMSPWLAFFWGPYLILINFALMRVVAALFLKQTMAVAKYDEERMAMEKAQRKELFAEELRKVFSMADKLGDGVLHRWEFDAALEEPKVMEIFNGLEMDEQEVVTVYNILSDEDGVADYEEFLAAALKIKNSARTFDIIQIMHEQTRQRRMIAAVHEGLEHLSSLFAQDKPWSSKKATFSKLLTQRKDTRKAYSGI